ncbi:restriction endonuclease subunit S [Caldifermentibacillus hisashii]|uniref:restriction endonuclease subunit S n=1 Tax=Caldifermentibacillus hisashii TaxID=996558 RepID=UPI002E22F3D2|nr:restriction endonuclease subunit S [Caldifermentibacillus hisashii]MED3643802.1 restriction endonuclease subunit S [Caldifermentibacillus hisashii]
MSSNNWNEYLIEDISEVVFSGGTPSTQKEEYWGGEYNWLSSGETRNTFITNTEKTITEAGVKNSSTKLAKKNDIVIASAGQGNTRGQVSLCKIDTFINQSIIAIRTNNKLVNPVYVFYNLKSRYKELRQISDGHSIRGSLTTKIINKMKINLPPIKDQNNIANILSSFDEKIEINIEINKKLEEMAQAIFKHWFVDFEFPNENGEPYKSSGGEMVESELGMIPKGWKIGSINDLGTIVSGGTPSKKKEEYYTEHGIPWITPKDLSLNKNRFISRGTIDITEEGLKNSSAKLMPKGTVLFSSRAPIGYIAIAKNEVSTNQGFKSIIPKNNIGSEFVYQFLKMNKEIIESRASGSTFKEISGGELKKIPAIIPSNNIIYRYNLITIKISSFIKNNEEELEKLRTIRDTLLPKLMSGEIRVPVEE